MRFQWRDAREPRAGRGERRETAFIPAAIPRIAFAESPSECIPRALSLTLTSSQPVSIARPPPRALRCRQLRCRRLRCRRLQPAAARASLEAAGVGCPSALCELYPDKSPAMLYETGLRTARCSG
jgi:hypothetical protein